jgi:hypothetical protein
MGVIVQKDQEKYSSYLGSRVDVALIVWVSSVFQKLCFIYDT